MVELTAFTGGIHRFFLSQKSTMAEIKLPPLPGGRFSINQFCLVEFHFLHMSSQDFVWGALFPKKVDLFQSSPSKDRQVQVLRL